MFRPCFGPLAASTLALLLSLPLAQAEPACAVNYAQLLPASAEAVPAITLPTPQFDSITKELSATLSGNLATVLRSEWKAKGPLTQSNAYVQDLLGFLTPGTRAEITAGLDPQREGYVRELSARLYKLRGREGDRLFVRDPPPPPGASDSTFTFYSRAVRDPAGGKHQLRIRNYLRRVDFDAIQAGVPVEGFSADGASLFSIAKQPDGSLLVKTTKGGVDTIEQMPVAQARRQLGDPLVLFAAPHGKRFKLEIKTRLKEHVGDGAFPNLAGQNFVQKLDVNLSLRQLQTLFGASPLSATERLALIEKDLLSAPNVDIARTKAVLRLIDSAAAADPAFLRLEGATQYSRSAFEIEVPDQLAGAKVRVQTTVDRELGAFRKVYGENGELLSPTEVSADDTRLLRPADRAEERHWELKVPKPLVERAAPVTAPGNLQVEVEPVSADLNDVINRFSLCNVTNRGKFVHICEQRPVNDRK